MGGLHNFARKNHFTKSVSRIALSLTIAAFAAPLAAGAAEPDQGSATEVIVTGSRIATRDFQSDSPIATVNSDALAAAGQPTLDRVIGEMPQFAAAQGTNEVGDVQGSTGFGGGQAYGDLRGLGPNRSLVLLDGRRLMSSNPNGAIDLNTIPMSMIENVEVITGGASAAYGSDAIAGVMNFKTRTKFNGAEIDVTHGTTTQNDGMTNHVSGIIGGDFDNKRGNAMVAFEYADRSVVEGSARPFFANIRELARPPEGIIPGGRFSGAQPTVAAVNSVLAGYPGTTPIAGSGLYNGAIGINTDGTMFTDLAGSNCVQNYKGLGPKGVNISPNCRQVQVALGQYFALQVPLTKYNFFAKGTYEVTDHINAYTQFSYMQSSALDETASGSTGPGKYFFVPLNNPYVTGNAALQTLLNSRTGDPSTLSQPLALTKLLTMSGNRVQTYDYDVYQAIVGFKGDIPGTGLTWDVYGSVGHDLFTNNQTNDTSKIAVANILNGTANYSGTAGSCVGYAWNPFGVQALSPGCREYVTRENHNTNLMTQKIFEGTVQGKILTLPAGDLRFAVGADYRGTSFDYRPDQGLINADTPSYDTAVGTSGSQNVNEYFAELLVPVLADLPFIEYMSLDGAYRHSDYNLFGGTDTWKVDASWAPIDSLRMRGGYSVAIRAPSLGELYAPTVTGNLNIGSGPNAGDPCAVGSVFRSGPNAARVAQLCQAQGVPAALYQNYTYGVDSVHGVSGGNTGLTPEQADTFSVGTVWTPSFRNELFHHFQASVDYYNIKITNAVGSLALTDIIPKCYNLDGASNPGYSASNLYCSLFQRDPRTGDIVNGREGLLNLSTYQTDGIDMQFDWKFAAESLGLPSDSGDVAFNSMISYIRRFDVAALPHSPVVNFAGTIGDSTASPEISHPEWKANTTLGYTLGDVSAAIHWRFIDAMKNSTPGAPGVPVYDYFDMDGHWTVRQGVELSIGATNITDKAPPFVSGQPLTTDSATYDIIGRTVFASLKLKV